MSTMVRFGSGSCHFFKWRVLVLFGSFKNRVLVRFVRFVFGSIPISNMHCSGRQRTMSYFIIKWWKRTSYVGADIGAYERLVVCVLLWWNFHHNDTQTPLTSKCKWLYQVVGGHIGILKMRLVMQLCFYGHHGYPTVFSCRSWDPIGVLEKKF